MRAFKRPGFDNGQNFRAGGACCDACAVGEACTGCDGGPELGPAEGCQTGACSIPAGRPAGAVFDAGAAARQAMRVGARASGEVAAGDADMVFTQEEAAEDQWRTMTAAERQAFLRTLGQRSGLTPEQAAQFAQRERDADYRLVQGLVTAGAGLVRELAANSSREEIERIRANARTTAARYGVSTNAEGEFLNVFRQSTLGGTAGLQQTTNNNNSTAMLMGLGLLAVAMMGGRR